MKTKNIQFPIFDSHLNYSCIVWAQNNNTVRRSHSSEESTSNMNFKDQLFHSSPVFSSNNICKICDRIKSGNILFVSKSSCKCPQYFMIGLHFQETYIGMKFACLYLTILIFQFFRPKKYGCFSLRASTIHSWNYTQDMLKINV